MDACLGRHFHEVTRTDRSSAGCDCCGRATRICSARPRPPGNENFPDTGRPHRAHLMIMPVPVVEVAHDTDALGVRRPNGKARSRHAIHRAQLRAQFIVQLAVVAFAEEKQSSSLNVGRKEYGSRIVRVLPLSSVMTSSYLKTSVTASVAPSNRPDLWTRCNSIVTPAALATGCSVTLLALGSSARATRPGGFAWGCRPRTECGERCLSSVSFRSSSGGRIMHARCNKAPPACKTNSRFSPE
jgi:hypothetical protein